MTLDKPRFWRTTSLYTHVYRITQSTHYVINKTVKGSINIADKMVAVLNDLV